MEIGKKIYYNKITGTVILDTGERMGNVVETTKEHDFAFYSQLSGLNQNDIDFIQLEYGERFEEFLNMGSMEVFNNELIIYPRLRIVSNKSQIASDGVETATITVSGIAEEIISFAVNNGTEYPIAPVDGIATFQLASSVTGTYEIVARSDKYGQNSVTVEVV